MNGIGTLEWTRRTRGRLSAAERASYLVRGVGTQIGAMSDRTLFTLGIGRDKLARLDLDSLRLPDSAVAKEAEQAAGDFPEWLWHHSQRSYVWALALAQLDGVRGFDEECLYVGCVLHDAGIGPAIEHGDDSCFTLRSAEIAGDCATRGGWDEPRADRLRESITLHVNPYVPPEQSLEGHLLSAGSTLDGVALRRYWKMDPELVQAVLRRHPRHGLKRELVPMLRAHSRAAPRCRIAFMYRWGRLGTLVSHSPFDE
ncbi:MAG TPA: hypothetical protein VJT75_19670 [Thermoleophilaceae bacterium]|nr:hypothetical protein [Thermoleophilaceae bacterium]